MEYAGTWAVTRRVRHPTDAPDCAAVQTSEFSNTHRLGPAMAVTWDGVANGLGISCLITVCWLVCVVSCMQVQQQQGWWL